MSPMPAARLGAALVLLAPLCACQSSAVPDAVQAPTRSRGQPISFAFPPAGAESEVSSESTRGRVTALLPYGQVSVIKDAGHVPNYSHPERLAALVRAFVKSGVETTL